jgi:hypothetical protein
VITTLSWNGSSRTCYGDTCDNPGLRLNRIDRILIPSRYTFFSENSTIKNFRVKRA